MSEPVLRRVSWPCHCCPFQATGMSDDALQAAMDDHAQYVNRTAEPRTDPHFADLRLDALCRA